MDFKINHDYHIHSYLSSCSNDPEQTAENILKYAEENGLEEICIADHFWDEDLEIDKGFYTPHTFENCCKILPLPQSDRVKFYFGCETELDYNYRLGITKEKLDKFDFIVVPTTHLHLWEALSPDRKYTLADRARIYIERLEALLNMDLPWEKVGIAHLTCSLMANETPTAHIEVIDLIDDAEFTRVFTKAAALGVGIELNFPFDRYTKEQLPKIMRPYVLAKKAGCKFYFASDSHHPKNFVGIKDNFIKIADYLKLTDSDRFKPFEK